VTAPPTLASQHRLDFPMYKSVVLSGVIAFLLAFCIALPAAAADNREALREITDAAETLCGTVQTTGESTSVKISGDVKAVINGLVKKLADLGITGSAEVNSVSYQGVLQQELATALKDVRECKLKVLDMLRTLLGHQTWHLLPEQRERLAGVACDRPPSDRYKMRILVLPSDQNSRLFGNDLSEVFYRCGWNTEYVSDYSLAPDLTGVSVQVPNGTTAVTNAPPKAIDLVSILRSANINAILRPPGTATMWDSPAIAVGAQPDP
jgi:hypothetical protein